jgi:hypothetical protein
LPRAGRELLVARFYFHTESESRVTDDVGVDLPSVEHARVEAARATADLLKDGAAVFWGTRPWMMTVTDAKGLIFLTLEVHGIDAPAAGVHSNEQ